MNFVDNLDNLDMDSSSHESSNGGDDDVPASWDAPEVQESKPETKKEKAESQKGKPKQEEKLKEQEQPKTESKPKEDAKPEKPSEGEAKSDNGEIKLRSPICVIMGHVDTGKTKLLDKIRRTNVQIGEAGGITQQIGATFFPIQTLKQKTQEFAQKYNLEYKLPGLLIIDTPGHESFTNLRSRGSSLCDVAILVVDIMHGVENQTKESIELLRAKKSVFVIALNKIDRVSDWKPIQDSTFENTYRRQSKHAQDNFKKLLNKAQTELQEMSINADPYFKIDFNKPLKVFPLVPTSAVTGEGIPELLSIVQLVAQNQTRLAQKLQTKSELQCTVLEVKVEEGIGTTLDVILVNGELHVNDTIVVAGLNGPIVTHIRALLTPQPLKELRVRSDWVHHEVVHAAMGCKIAAPDLDAAIAGSELFVAKDDDEIDHFLSMVKADVDSIYGQVDKNGEGVFVQASTLGSLEALLNHLKASNVKVSMVGIGPVHRKDVVAISHMAEKDPRYAVILAFDVPITHEAKQAAESLKVTIFSAEIIYHLTDQYTAFLDNYQRELKEKARSRIVFPAKITLLPEMVFNRSKPIIMGIRVLEGTLRKGTPLVAALENGQILNLGSVEAIKFNNKDVDTASTNAEVSIQLKGGNDNIIAGKDFKPGDPIISKMDRTIINLLKDHFREDLKKEDWTLVVQIKKLLHIQ